MKSRAEFSLATKRRLASDANNQCSYLNCPVRTSGPDLHSGGTLKLGKAAHIYSASVGGPRGQGGLTNEELRHHQNGIWLCANHAYLIDENDGIGHPAEKLFSFKRLHEHRVQKEVLGICKTVGWVDEIQLAENPLFEPGETVRLGKLTLLFGDNSLGKSTLAKFIGAFFDIKILRQWYSDENAPLRISMSYYTPEPLTIGFVREKGMPGRYEVNGEYFSKNPLNYRLILVPEFSEDFKTSDVAAIAEILSVPEWEIASLVPLVNQCRFSNLKNYVLSKSSKRTKLDRLTVNAYEQNFSVPFKRLATSEKKMVLIDFATALARKTSYYQPTLLFLDCNLLSNRILFEKFESLLLARDNQFQTILTAQLNGIDLSDVQWRGWEVICLYEGASGRTRISQDPKMKIEPRELQLDPPSRKR